MFRWLVIILLCILGCKSPPVTPSRQTITYTFDALTLNLISQLAQRGHIPAYQNFNRHFKGLFVPGYMLAYEPFVLGLSTESKIPTVLLLDAPWARRYAMAGWLYELENTGIFSKEALVPAVAEAFSISLPWITGRAEKELMAVPTSIKGNFLFYRQDLMTRYHQDPPRDWESLKAICRKILPQERSLKYGLVFHVSNFMNDFYPILWGFGGIILDNQGRLVLNQPENLAAAIAALREICQMRGTLAPSAAELKDFEAPKSLRQSFFRGEALFMINWNTRLQDLKKMIEQADSKTPRSLINMDQIGVVPIPSRAGHPHRYSNIGSFGWGINRFAITGTGVMETAKQFIQLVTDDRFQVLAAETLGQVPALKSALQKVKSREVWLAYRKVFTLPDVVLRPRPQSRLINNTLEKYLLEALYGQTPPDVAMTAAGKEIQELLRAE